MHAMLHQLITWYFQSLLDGGYPLIAGLMAMESTVVPLPSEVIIPPAAYWAAQGKLSYVGVVLAGTIGSVAGAALMYALSRWLGRPLVVRYGRFVGLGADKIEKAERFLGRYERGGVFFARLLPVVRHLIGIPAGLVRMPFGPYLAMTTLGSALWCAVLTWFGQMVLGDKPQLLDNPDNLAHALRDKSLPLVLGVVAVLVLYIVVVRMTRKDAD